MMRCAMRPFPIHWRTGRPRRTGLPPTGSETAACWTPCGSTRSAHPSGMTWDGCCIADFLEPGRDRIAPDRADLARRVPIERDAVLREVARRRIEWLVRSGWPLPAATVAFWNQLVGRADGRTAGRS